jgi:hypothetical protein
MRVIDSYMALSRLSLAAACALLCFGAPEANVHPGLNEVKRVYLLPMAGGLDQYLANRLTKMGRFEVVTDPAAADAIFTDRLGPSFEQKWAELYPPPPKPEEERPIENEGKSNSTEPSLVDGFAGTTTSRVSSFARGRGNVFIVSRKDGAVVWSHFKPARNTRTSELDSTADGIVNRLHSDLGIKK